MVLFIPVTDVLDAKKKELGRKICKFSGEKLMR
jgi:hypothetical protein